MNNHFFIENFEKELSKYTGAPYVVLTDSCTHSVFLALYWLKTYAKLLSRGASVKIPRHNYISIPMQLLHLGLEVEFSDEKWDGIYQLGDLPVYDSAQRFTSNMYIKDSLMCLSFQQKKILNIGKGGAILLDNKEAYEILKRLTWDGRDSSISVKNDENIILGFHMNMTPDAAASGLLKLNVLKKKNKNNGDWSVYPDISEYEVFKNKLEV